MTLVFDFQGGRVKPFSLALLTGHVHIRQKMHLHLDMTISPTGLAPTPLHIEGVAPLWVSTQFRLRQQGIKIPYMIKHFCVGGRVAAWCSADGLLIDVDHLVEV